MRGKTILVLAVASSVLLVLTMWSVFRIAREARHFEEETVRDHRLLGEALARAYAHVAADDGHQRAIELVEQQNLEREHIDIRWVSFDASAAPRDRSQLAQGSQAELLRRGTLFRVSKDRQEDGDAEHAITTWVLVEPRSLASGAIRLRENLIVQDDFLAQSALRAALAALSAAALAAIVVILFFRLAEAQARAEKEREKRDEALDQLRHAERLGTVGKLASGVAHELGTPLNVIGGRAKMIETGESTGATAVNDARIIREQSTRMAEIIRQLLDFARRSPAKRERVDVADVARRTLELLRPIAHKSHVELDLESPAQPIEVSFDPGQLQQVMSNLVLNAIQAQESGGSVAIGVARRNGSVSVVVRDRGPGMDEDTKNHIFEPFFTTKDVGKGTGLGLSVAWGIVREHDGSIEVDSTPGEGSRFTVTLPRAT